MLSERINGSLPIAPHEKEGFKTKLVNPVAHVVKAVASWIGTLLKAPISAALVVSAFFGSFSAEWPVLLLTAVLAALTYLESKEHKLCLRPSDSPSL